MSNIFFFRKIEYFKTALRKTMSNEKVTVSFHAVLVTDYRCEREKRGCNKWSYTLERIS